MLPLWIIDLRDKSDRRMYFEKLLGQIDHVYINTGDSLEEDLSSSELSDAAPDRPESGNYNVGAGQGEDSSSAPASPSSSSSSGSSASDSTSNSASSSSSGSTSSSISSPSLQEALENKDKEEADKNSVIIGDYWRYSPMQQYFYGISIHHDHSSNDEQLYDASHRLFPVEKNPTAKGTAERLYKFQSDLVEEGQKFIEQLRKSNANPDIKINIVVLGDLTEDFTRIVFPSIAGILQKEKGRMLPHHIHQGMEIIGMLYMPSNINTLDVKVRRSMQRTINEIDVQNQVNDIRGYDHVMYYQDVQNRTECTYQQLDYKQLAEYLLQILVHLYLATNVSHPLLSGTASADMFYFSMGATSVHFDTENEDLKARHKFAQEIIRSFKSEGDDEKEAQDFHILVADEYSPSTFFVTDEINNLSCDEIEEDIPSPHPIRNFMAKYLKRYYYNLYLRFFTRNMMHKIISRIDETTRESLETLATKSKRRFTDTQKKIKENLREILARISANDGGVPTLIRLFKQMQDNFSQKRSEIQNTIEENYWREIESERISKNMRDTFMEYHDAYIADIKNKTGGSNQQDLKNQAVTELNGVLSKESTMLSRICRSILMGIMLALALFPVLNFISPDIIDLGNVRKDATWWTIGIFFVPALIQLFSYWRYTRKKKRAVNNIKAMHLHDAYARVANRIESEINSFYDKIIAIGDKYISRCEDIRKEIGKDFLPDGQGKTLFPESMFNQPLIGGQFGGDKLLPLKEADDAEVRINYIRYKLSDVTKNEHYLFINQNKNLMMELFEDIHLTENLVRRIKDNGEEELLTKEQQEKELRQAWERHRNKFHSSLKETVKEAVLPREDGTVGEKLFHYYTSNPEKVNVLRSMIAYAATNGEVVSSADMEFADTKMNDKRIEDCILPFISTPNVQLQSDKYNNTYSKYIFVTRWRSFEHISFNRILPTEDFDEKIRRQRVYVEEIKGNKNWTSNEYRNMEEEKVQKKHENGLIYKPKVSSLLLWALCPDDSSSEWFRLFDSEFFAEAYEDKNIFRSVLNIND